MMGAIGKENINQKEENWNRVERVVRVFAACALHPGIVQADRVMDIKEGGS